MIRAILPALLLAPALGFAADDMARANGYDDAWQAAWTAHAKATRAAAKTKKTPGLVLQVGDSITHANPYSQWARRATGATPADQAVLGWCHAAHAVSADPANPNGFALAIADVNGRRGVTASGGMDCSEFLSGDGNAGAAMPDLADQAAARAALADGSAYDGNLRASTVAAAYADAEVAVIMLGTNDVNHGKSVDAVKQQLGAIVDAFTARRIVVVLSTIPPHHANDALAAQVSDAIGALAKEKKLALIDYRAEILARRPADWNGTLMNPGDVHPTAGVGGFNAASDPYADGGDAASHRTGAAASSSGYLLRSWLTIQKLKEVRAALDG
ncbi:MAG TPA: SGNH/GDSL hydrolase family protein [Planctomycetota bacterium]|nr:SGNH/GDSL hydrolase family protein [Planctomycetota bacterium]